MCKKYSYYTYARLIVITYENIIHALSHFKLTFLIFNKAFLSGETI